MSLKDLEARMDALEKRLEQLQLQLGQTQPVKDRRFWWRAEAGHFANDPIFDEVVRLGREYRESLRPGKPKSKKAKNGRA